jgi:hypothetical protein
MPWVKGAAAASGAHPGASGHIRAHRAGPGRADCTRATMEP